MTPPTCIKCGTPLWHLVFVVDRGVMDGTRLNQAADTLNELADDVDEFTTKASEKAAEVADKIREVATQVRQWATEAGTESGTTPTA